MSEPERCPLCYSRDLTLFAEVNGRTYWRCAECMLTSIAPNFLLDEEDERTSYLAQPRDPANPADRASLAPLLESLALCVPAGGHGLDYGSGPVPVVQIVLQEHGYTVANYDIFFAYHPQVYHDTYDFITCVHTIEHIYNPASDFARFDWLLKPGAYLAILTEVLTDDSVFADWPFLDHPARVCFYRPETFEWLAGHHDWTLSRPHPHIALLRRSPDAPDREL